MCCSRAAAARQRPAPAAAETDNARKNCTDNDDTFDVVAPCISDMSVTNEFFYPNTIGGLLKRVHLPKVYKGDCKKKVSESMFFL